MIARATRERIYGTVKGHRRFLSTADEDLLRTLKDDPSYFSWTQISELVPGFSARQLRERWANYLFSTLKTSGWTEEEDPELLRLQAELRRHWGLIGSRMGNRSAPDIKNRFQSVLNQRGNVFRAAGRESAQAHGADCMPKFPSPFWPMGICALPPLVTRPRAEANVTAPDGPPDFSIQCIVVEPGYHWFHKFTSRTKIVN